EDIELDVEVYKVAKVERAPRPFQKHTMVRNVDVAPRHEARRFPAGTIMVRTDQPLGTFAAVLLEPQSEDGLTTWNFFDSALKEGEDFPIVRLPAEVPVIAGAIRPLAEDRPKDRPLDLAAAFGPGQPPNFNGNPVGGITWLDDGEHFLQNKSGKL